MTRKIISIEDVRFLAMQALETGDTKELEAAFDSLGISGKDLDGAKEKLLKTIEQAHSYHSEIAREIGEAAAAMVEAAQEQQHQEQKSCLTSHE